MTSFTENSHTHTHTHTHTQITQGTERARQRESRDACEKSVRSHINAISSTIPPFLHPLPSPPRDNEVASALPPPHRAYLLCTKGSERYFWSPSSHLFPWFGDDNNHCGWRCHIQINCHSSGAIGPASPCSRKRPCTSSVSCLHPSPPLPSPLLPSLPLPPSLLEAIQRALKQRRLICFLVELIQISCLKTNLVCIVMSRGRAFTIDNLLIQACKRAGCSGAVNMKWIRFLPVVIQITL